MGRSHADLPQGRGSGGACPTCVPACVPAITPASRKATQSHPTSTLRQPPHMQMVEKDIGFVGEVTAVCTNLLHVSHRAGAAGQPAARVNPPRMTACLHCVPGCPVIRSLSHATCHITHADAGELRIHPGGRLGGLGRRGPGPERQRRHRGGRGAALGAGGRRARAPLAGCSLPHAAWAPWACPACWAGPVALIPMPSPPNPRALHAALPSTPRRRRSRPPSRRRS